MALSACVTTYDDKDAAINNVPTPFASTLSSDPLRQKMYTTQYYKDKTRPLPNTKDIYLTQNALYACSYNIYIFGEQIISLFAHPPNVRQYPTQRGDKAEQWMDGLLPRCTHCQHMVG